jgi:hypothetical protein
MQSQSRNEPYHIGGAEAEAARRFGSGLDSKVQPKKVVKNDTN